VDLRSEEGQELLTQLISLPRDGAGIFSTNFPARGWLAYDALKAHRDDLIMVNLVGRRDGGSEVDYTVNPQLGLPAMTGPEATRHPVNHVLPAWDLITGQTIATAVLAAERHRRLTGAASSCAWRSRTSPWPPWATSACSPRRPFAEADRPRGATTSTGPSAATS
jgi:2-methylfumaryl-CoA isomerase